MLFCFLFFTFVLFLQASLKSIGCACFIENDTIAVGDDLGVVAVWNLNGRHIGRFDFF